MCGNHLCNCGNVFRNVEIKVRVCGNILRNCGNHLRMSEIEVRNCGNVFRNCGNLFRNVGNILRVCGNVFRNEKKEQSITCDEAQKLLTVPFLSIFKRFKRLKKRPNFIFSKARPDFVRRRGRC